MQQKAVKFSLPSKKKDRQRRVILGLGENCPQIVFRRLKSEVGVRGGGGGSAGPALSSSLPREDAEPQSQTRLLADVRKRMDGRPDCSHGRGEEHAMGTCSKRTPCLSGGVQRRRCRKKPVPICVGPLG